MKIAVPTEIKNNEFRVAITPAGVHDLVGHGHEVLVQAGAGEGSSISDEQYATAGATILPDAASVWASADLLLKVKEPVSSEYGYFRAGLVLFTYLHLAAEPELTRALLASGVTAIAYETVQLPSRSLPLLAPMSEVAGRLAPIVGANAMLKPNGGLGLLVPGVPGTHPAKIAVLGGGVAGTAAMQVSLGLGAEVTVLDTNLFRLREIDSLHFGRVKTIASNSFEIDKAVSEADMVIGSVLIPGAKAPKLVSNELVSRMKPGSVLVDIAVDQGGCFEGTHPTTHADPTFTVHRSLFYCVANMPGAVPHTSTYALTNATLPYIRALATLGWVNALRADPSLALGLNVFGGHLISAPVAIAHGLRHRPLAEVLNSRQC
ncbi:alanine dehydrogenase [Cryobacterium sp. Y11]|uniref:alanine dehydrogenase n=1 Tax=Cryobacterium sp. Y11 TaxID=2045016 RepID=UPI000CE35A23|nr:alanine dehydrogenase [Cryobacterium sp. Y11]